MTASTDPLYVVRPRALVWSVVGVSLIVLGAPLIAWIALPQAIRDQAPSAVLVGTVIILLAIVAFIASVAMTKVTAQSDGLVVRNGPFSTHYAWHEISGFRFQEGDSWAYVSTFRTDADGDSDIHPIMALQRPDGDRARLGVARLREIWRQRRP